MFFMTLEEGKIIFFPSDRKKKEKKRHLEELPPPRLERYGGHCQSAHKWLEEKKRVPSLRVPLRGKDAKTSLTFN